MRPSDSMALLELLMDQGSFERWDCVRPTAPSPYEQVLESATTRAGLDEAIITGRGRLGGRPLAVIASEFGFLAGSIGRTSAGRIVACVERATAARLPILALPASGGTRMQEGASAFVQMVGIAASITAHRDAGLPYLVYLRHPTTGGALASWGSLGHVTFAEPGALIGFLGPRVYEALHGSSFPPGVQVAENLHARGLVDGVLAPEQLPVALHGVLDVVMAPRRAATDAWVLHDEEPDEVPAWSSILASRRETRPGIHHLLAQAARDVTLLHGTGEGEYDPGVVLALGRFGDVPAVVVGQDRRVQTTTRMGPAGLRQVRRGIRLAEELRLPLVTVIDTPGAALSQPAEEGGLAGQIARCLSEAVTLPSPTLSVLMGQGTGGGALALLPADRVLAAQHAWLSPLPPEAASLLVHRDTEQAAKVAADQGVRSSDLLRAGIVDRVVPERPDAADEPDAFCRRLGDVLQAELVALTRTDPAERRAARRARYRLG